MEVTQIIFEKSFLTGVLLNKNQSQKSTEGNLCDVIKGKNVPGSSSRALEHLNLN